jgi:thiosulfate/3-mercaptopyruvate sulfurtransferase
MPHAQPATLTPEPHVDHATEPHLVDAPWLAAHLLDVRVVDTRRSGDFLDGHVPGACSFPLDALLVEDTTWDALERLARAAQAALALRGILPSDRVVLVDDADGSAALGALVCELAGLRDVSVLQGGITSWHRIGQTVDHVPMRVDAIAIESWEGATANLRGLATIEQLELAVASETAIVVDTRSQLEHEGIVGPPCCGRRGAIPSSFHVEWTAFFDASGQPHAPERVRAIAEHLGMHRDDALILTCHAGHRAAWAACILRHAGFTNVRVSLGSWHEWAGQAR